LRWRGRCRVEGRVNEMNAKVRIAYRMTCLLKEGMKKRHREKKGEGLPAPSKGKGKKQVKRKDDLLFLYQISTVATWGEKSG